MSDLDKGAGGKKPKRYRDLDKVWLGEISAVGKPAQEDAAILLAKAAPPDGEGGRTTRKENADELAKYAVLTSATLGHSHLLITDDTMGARQNGHTGEGKMVAPGSAGGYTGYGYHDHPWYRDAAGNIIIGETLGHTHEVTGDMAKAEGSTMSGTTGTNAGAGEAKAPKTEDVVKGLQAQVEKLTAEAGFSDDERTLYKSLDEKGQEAFRKAKPDERKAQVEKAAADAKADGTIYKAADGTVYNAGEHGEAALKLAKQVDELTAQATRDRAMAKAAREEADLRKEIADDYAHLPGTEAHKVALLKSVKGIADEEARKAALELLKARDLGNSELMKERGTAAGHVLGGDAPAAAMEKMEKDYAAANKVSIAEATLALSKSDEAYRKLYAEAQGH